MATRCARSLGLLFALSAPLGALVACSSSASSVDAGAVSDSAAVDARTHDVAASSHACVPGKQVACTCAGGATGAQTCEASGEAYGACTGCPSTSSRESESKSSHGSTGSTAGASVATSGSSSSAPRDGGADASSCHAGALRCSAHGAPEVCTDGAWAPTGTTCTGVTSTCLNGACVACTPGENGCDGQQPQTCSATGAWLNAGTVCDANQTCVAGSCTGACGPTEVQCKGSQPQDCSPRGTWKDQGAACSGSTPACLDGACVACLPSTTQCGPGGSVETCSPAGVWGDAVPCPAATPACAAGACGEPPSCQAGAPGAATDCGGTAGTSSCCASILVAGTTFGRDGNASYPATLSSYRLDMFDVTVGRFRQFVGATVAGWTPAVGSGTHTHLNGGSGLANSGTGGGFESGWQMPWTAHVPKTAAAWKTALSCSAPFEDWTAAAGGNETLPINCVSWFEAYAFCIWDGGFLPSDAELNNAAEGGPAENQYPWGAASPRLDTTLAVYDCLYPAAAEGLCSGVANLAPVGSSPAGDGLFGQADLSGNVWQWSLDWFEEPYTTTTCTDCADTTDSQTTTRALRGSTFQDSSSLLVSSNRVDLTPASSDYEVGIRCARTP